MYANTLYQLLCVNNGPYSVLIAVITLKTLAPWIMLFITLWGIGRLFRTRHDAEESMLDEPEQDSLASYEEDELYEDYDEDDDYDAEG